MMIGRRCHMMMKDVKYGLVFEVLIIFVVSGIETADTSPSEAVSIISTTPKEKGKRQHVTLIG